MADSQTEGKAPDCDGAKLRIGTVGTVACIGDRWSHLSLPTAEKTGRLRRTTGSQTCAGAGQAVDGLFHVENTLRRQPSDKHGRPR